MRMTHLFHNNILVLLGIRNNHTYMHMDVYSFVGLYIFYNSVSDAPTRVFRASIFNFYPHATLFVFGSSSSLPCVTIGRSRAPLIAPMCGSPVLHIPALIGRHNIYVSIISSI